MGASNAEYLAEVGGDEFLHVQVSPVRHPLLIASDSGEAPTYRVDRPVTLPDVQL